MKGDIWTCDDCGDRYVVVTGWDQRDGEYRSLDRVGERPCG
jgi:hypothetical protein